MSTKIIRKYKLSDGILLAHIGKVLDTLPGDLSSIEVNFPMINESFLDGLITDHINALAEGGDDVAKGQVGELTQTLLHEMEQAKHIVKRLRFWVGEAFRGNPAKQKAFGLTKFWKVANNQPKLVQFMNTLNTVAIENSQPLLDIGMGQLLLDELQANASALSQADAKQESSKGGRTNATQERILALNSLYERGLMLDRVADIAYEDDPAKRAFYNMPVASPKAEDLEEEDDQV